jgi:hypothetical protein
MTDSAFFQRFIAQIDALRQGGVAPQPGWRVYANTGLLGCIDALQANYPSVYHLMGEQRFRAMAAHYVRASAAHDGRLFLYGQSLPAWLAEHDGADSASDVVAQLDRNWTEVHAEADAPLLDMAWLAQQSPATLAQLQLRPAPATRWQVHRGLPLWDWWQGLRQPCDDAVLAGGGGHGVLWTRPGDAVLSQALPLPGAVLLDACDAGLTLPQALEAVTANLPDTDLQGLLADVFAAGAFQHPDQFTPKGCP